MKPSDSKKITFKFLIYYRICLNLRQLIHLIRKLSDNFTLLLSITLKVTFCLATFPTTSCYVVLSQSVSTRSNSVSL